MTLLYGPGLSKNQNESGIVAVVVTVLVLIVLSLTTLGFARLAQREQRQALDKLLSSQAAYAAESGVSDAIRNILNGGHYSSAANNKSSTCGPDFDLPGATGTDTTSLNAIIQGETGGSRASSEYSCLLINQAPLELTKTVGTQKSSYADITTSANIGSIVVGWQGSAVGSTFADSVSTTLPTAMPDSTDTSVLRLDITSLNGLTPYLRNNLYNRTRTIFLYPYDGGVSSTAGGTITLTSSVNDSGIIAGVTCNVANNTTNLEVAGSCSAKISGLNNIDSVGTHYFIRLKSLYSASTVKIRALDVAGTTQLPVMGDQVSIDATGKAGDVLKRIQVNISKRPNFDFPENAIESVDHICKVWTYKGSGSTPGTDRPTECPIL